MSEKWFKVETPDYEHNDTNKRSYLRLGSPDTKYEETFIEQGSKYALPGWLAYTDGHRFVETRGDLYTINHGDVYSLTQGEVKKHSEGDHFEFKWGYDCEVGMGAKFESFIGFASEVFLGGKFEAKVTPLPSVAMNTGFEINYGCTAKYEAVTGSNVTLCKKFEQEAKDGIEFSVDPDDTRIETWFENIIPVIAAGGAAVAGIAGTVGGILGNIDAVKDGGKGVTYGAQGLADVLYVAGTINALLDTIRRKRNVVPDQPRAKITMDKQSIELRVGQKSAITLTNDTITLNAGKIVMIPSDDASATLDAGGFTVVNRDVLVKGGDVAAPDGAVKAKEVLAAERLVGKTTSLGQAQLLNRVNEPGYMYLLRRQLKKRRNGLGG